MEAGAGRGGTARTIRVPAFADRPPRDASSLAGRLSAGLGTVPATAPSAAEMCRSTASDVRHCAFGSQLELLPVRLVTTQARSRAPVRGRSWPIVGHTAPATVGPGIEYARRHGWRKVDGALDAVVWFSARWWASEAAPPSSTACQPGRFNGSRSFRRRCAAVRCAWSPPTPSSRHRPLQSPRHHHRPTSPSMSTSRFRWSWRRSRWSWRRGRWCSHARSGGPSARARALHRRRAAGGSQETPAGGDPRPRPADPPPRRSAGRAAADTAATAEAAAVVPQPRRERSLRSRSSRSWRTRPSRRRRQTPRAGTTDGSPSTRATRCASSTEAASGAWCPWPSWAPRI